MFRQIRPQLSFESLSVESFHLLALIWEVILLAHSKSTGNDSELLNLLETKSERVEEIADEVFELKKEIGEEYYKKSPEMYQQDWYEFVKELGTLQNDFFTLSLRLFLFKDVLMQIDESHPQWESLNEVLQTNYEKLIKTKSLIRELEFETAGTTFNAIAIARSIAENISFEEAYQRETKRWE